MGRNFMVSGIGLFIDLFNSIRLAIGFISGSQPVFFGILLAKFGDRPEAIPGSE